MIRLLHLADLHLGRAFQMLGEKGAAQRRALEAALIRAVDLAIAERVHLVLVAGDLGVIPGNTPHEAYFPEDTEVIDVFAPPREDMFTGGDTYLTR